MATYASDTKVSPEKSRQEIERTLTRYGATGFGFFSEADRAVIMFVADNRRVRFDIEVPDERDFTYTRPGGREWASGSRSRTVAQRKAAQEQAVRQRWRALALVVKAKLEAVQAGIVTFEQEFLAHIMLPDGSTVGTWAAPQLEAVYESGEMPPLLPPAQRLLGSGS